MVLHIEDYGVIGDMHSTTQVGIDGSIDWLCLPRSHSSACFANLLGTEENGRWRIAPTGNVVAATRRYRRSFSKPSSRRPTASFGSSTAWPCACRIHGSSVSRRACAAPYLCPFGSTPGSTTARPRRRSSKDQAVSAGAGPDAVELRADVPIMLRERRLEAEYSVRAGERACFVLTWYHSWEDAPPPIDAVDAVAETDAWWRGLVGSFNLQGCVGGRGRALPHHVQGPDPRARWRARGRRRHVRSPSSLAACETGTTGSVGSGTRRSRSTR